MVAVHPAAGFDVDRLAGLEHLLEHVAVAVDPDHALLVGGKELVDEEAAAVDHVGEALDPAVVVLDVAGGGQELVLADDDPVTGGQVQGGDVPGRVTAEGDLAGRLGLDQQQRHAAEDPALETLLERVQPDLHGRVLPQEHVVLEIHRDVAVQGHVQHGDQLALQAVVQSRRGTLRDRGGEDRRCGRHGVTLCLSESRGRPSVRPPPVAGPRYRASAARTDETPSGATGGRDRPPGRSRPHNRRRGPDLRHRTSQPGHRFDRRGDRLRRAQAAAGPDHRVRRRSASGTATRRPAGCWSDPAPAEPSPALARDAARPGRDADELSDGPPGRADPRGGPGDGQGRPRAGADRRRERCPDRGAHRAGTGPPVHPRVAPDLHPGGGPDLHLGDRVRARSRVAARRGPPDVRARLGAFDGEQHRERHLGGRRGRGRRPGERPGARGHARRRSADRLQFGPAVEGDPRAGRREGTPPSPSRRWTATSRDA